MMRAMIVCTLVLGALLGGMAADDARPYLSIGDTWQVAVQILGKPSGASTLSEGRVLFFYGQAQVTMQDGKVEKWKDFPLPSARVPASPLIPGVTPATVYAALGWPSTAYRAPQPANSPVKEIWEYGKASLTFLNNRLCAWVHAGAAGISLGEKIFGATFTLGSSRQEAIAAVGTPDTLEVQSSGEYWHLGADTLTLQAGKVTAWENGDHALPLRAAARRAEAESPALGATTGDVVAALGQPLAIELSRQHTALWCFAKTALLLDESGQVSEGATSRLQLLLGAVKPGTRAWYNLLPWLMAQPHLDYHADTPLTRETLYQRFLAANKEAILYGKFSNERGAALYASLGHTGNNLDFLAGIKAALSAGSRTAATQLLKRHVSNGFAAGVEQVAQEFQRYLNDAFAQYLTAGKYVQLSDADFSGKQGGTVSTKLTALGLTVDIVAHRDSTVTSGVVTDSYPAVGDYLPPQGAVTLYVAQ